MSTSDYRLKYIKGKGYAKTFFKGTCYGIMTQNQYDKLNAFVKAEFAKAQAAGIEKAFNTINDSINTELDALTKACSDIQGADGRGAGECRKRMVVLKKNLVSLSRTLDKLLKSTQGVVEVDASSLGSFQVRGKMIEGKGSPTISYPSKAIAKINLLNGKIGYLADGGSTIFISSESVCVVDPNKPKKDSITSKLKRTASGVFSDLGKGFDVLSDKAKKVSEHKALNPNSKGLSGGDSDDFIPLPMMSDEFVI